MTYETKEMAAGGYRYIPGEFQYSSGVAAEPGFQLVRARFEKVVPVVEGFKRIEAHLSALGRPLAAFAACELRSPKPFDKDGFRSFNQIYTGTLREWGICKGDDNPVARSNVCPLFGAPEEPGFFAFSYTVPTENGDTRPSFVITGQAETIETPEDPYFIVERGNVSEEGMLKKGPVAIDEIERRLRAFGKGWADTTAVHIYTVYGFHRLMTEEMGPRGMNRGGLTWHVCRPPVVDADFEMDCRGVPLELVLPVD